jgi:RNA polymerase sigma-70 factor, ECF subfamily
VNSTSTSNESAAISGTLYVLHDIFQVPFETIAETVGRPTATCRQLARRAPLKLEQSERLTRFEVTLPEHHAVTERFIEACAIGDFNALVRVLDPDVSGVVDLRPGLVVHGAHQVARNIIRYWGRPATLVSVPLGRQPSVIAFVDRELVALIELDVDSDRIQKIHVTARPETLVSLRTQLVAR